MIIFFHIYRGVIEFLCSCPSLVFFLMLFGGDKEFFFLMMEPCLVGWNVEREQNHVDNFINAYDEYCCSKNIFVELCHL